jgi:hypothetical protein
MPEWSPELKAQVEKDYLAANPTPENTSEVVKTIAEGLGEGYTPNGVMSILVKREVYIKKNQVTAKKEGTTSKRVNKADAVNELTEAIEANGLDADGDIIGKLTGKAAVYFKEIIEKLTEED